MKTILSACLVKIFTKHADCDILFVGKEVRDEVGEKVYDKWSGWKSTKLQIIDQKKNKESEAFK